MKIHSVLTNYNYSDGDKYKLVESEVLNGVEHFHVLY